MKSKHWIVILLIALIGSNIYWLLFIFDIGITTTYREAEYESTSKMLDQTMRLANMNLIGIDADVAMSRIGKGVYGTQPYIKDGCIYAGNVCLKLDESRAIMKIEEPPFE
jgi:hypothetical protein